MCATSNPAAGVSRRWASFDAAMADFDRAIILKPDDPALRKGRSFIRRARGEFDAVAELKQAAGRPPDESAAANSLAWFLLTGPLKHRDAAQAVLLAEGAVRARPSDGGRGNTLSLAYYRVGRFADALRALEANRPHNAPIAGHDLLVLAMTYHQLGRLAEARGALDDARRWRRSQAVLPGEFDADFSALRWEVEALIPAPDLPADVFAPSEAANPVDDRRP